MTGICFAAALALLFLLATVGPAQEPGGPVYRIPVRVTSDLPCPNVPLDPSLDFAALIEQAGLPGVLDPNSITVVDLATGEIVPHALGDDFAHGDAGRIEWVG